MILGCLGLFSLRETMDLLAWFISIERELQCLASLVNEGHNAMNRRSMGLLLVIGRVADMICI